MMKSTSEEGDHAKQINSGINRKGVGDGEGEPNSFYLIIR
jgi:hypothetical protein